MRALLLTLLSIYSLFGLHLHGQETNVNTIGRKLYVNGKDYLIKGICYHPVPKRKR